MLIHWLAVVVFLAGSGHLHFVWGTVFVAPPCRVNAHREAELTLGCGDETTAGVVQYWHTPFGQVQRAHTHQDPVYMLQDGSLVVPNISEIHKGLYYCLQQHTKGTAVWWYQLQITSDLQNAYRHEGHCGGLRVRRSLGGPGSKQEDSVSQEQLVGAVVGSVLLTFVVGFSAGALSRTHVLRCIRAVGRGHTPQHQQTDPQDPHPEALLSTQRPESTLPPAKPRRSFKRDEEPQTTAYLETCDYRGEEEDQNNLGSDDLRGAEDVRGAREEKGAGEVNGMKRAEKVRSTDEVISAEDVSCVERMEGTEDASGAEEVSEGSSAEEVRDAEEGKGAEDVKDEDEVSVEKGTEEVRDGSSGDELRIMEEVEMSVEEVRGEELFREEGRDSEGEKGAKEERGAEAMKDADDVKGEEEVRGAEEEDQSDSSTDSEGGPIEGGTEDHAGAQTGEVRRPRVRVIRLYQFNEDGERYYHLPGPSPQEPGPLPSLKQRSLSLTRLRAIMATASSGPLETPEDDRQTEQKAHFCMDS